MKLPQLWKCYFYQYHVQLFMDICELNNVQCLQFYPFKGHANHLQTAHRTIISYTSVSFGQNLFFFFLISQNQSAAGNVIQ